HEAFSAEKLMKLIEENPKAKVIAHPESEAHILKIAEFIGSTTQLLKYAQENPATEFIVGTEVGILHQMAQDVPNKTLIPLPAKEDNTCACSECHFMKVNTLEKLYNCLKNESPAVEVPEEISIEAIKPIERMLDLSK
ncbi:MAG: quinolinate synthase NadA, partial [Cytophagales bacterium]|nr:quinolinate synthase NadA [Cytophagales bacterium]